MKSRQKIQSLAGQTQEACIRIFDVNLRTPFFSGEVIQESLDLATVLKMNEDELPQVMRLLGLAGEEEPGRDGLRAGADRLLAEFPSLEMLAITRGGRGSVLGRRDEWN